MRTRLVGAKLFQGWVRRILMAEWYPAAAEKGLGDSRGPPNQYQIWAAFCGQPQDKTIWSEGP
jgi:hypothetical protein